MTIGLERTELQRVGGLGLGLLCLPTSFNCQHSQTCLYLGKRGQRPGD